MEMVEPVSSGVESVAGLAVAAVEAAAAACGGERRPWRRRNGHEDQAERRGA